MAKKEQEEVRRITGVDRIRNFINRYRDGKGRPPRVIPSVYSAPPDPEAPLPTDAGVADDEIDHGRADRGQALTESTPPKARTSKPLYTTKGGKIVSRDGSVHGGAYEEGNEPPPGPVDPGSGRPKIIGPNGDPLEDVPQPETRKRPRFGPAPGDRIAS